MFRFIKIFINDFIELLFPALCIGCNKILGINEKILCTQCRINLPETGQHRKVNDQYLVTKFSGGLPIRFSVSYVYFTKGGIVQKLIHAIKYKNQKEAAKVIANWYGYQLVNESNLVGEIDVIIGVPLHKSRMQQRGYNQADWIAEGLAEMLNVKSRTDVLVRTQFESSQTRKSRLERWDNVKTVFAVSKPEAIKGKNVVLVDDVLTTGATVEACALELFKTGCKSISVITLAVTK